MSGENAISSVVANLSGGAGVDIRKLAQDLTDVERLPIEERLTKSIDKESNQISAYAVVKYNVEQFISKLEALDDESELLEPQVRLSDTSHLEVSEVLGTAQSGTYSVSVTALATQQVNISNVYSASSQSLNSGSSFSLSITDSGNSVNAILVAAGSDTPSGIVDAINTADIGISASLLPVGIDGDEFRIILSGASGSANSFTVSSSLADSDLGFHDSGNGNSVQVNGVVAQQSASNASFTINGVDLERSSNTVSDALQGVTLNLSAVHSSGTSQLTIEKNQSNLKSKLQDLVSAYNLIRSVLSDASNPDSLDDEVGASLTSDFAAVRQVRTVMYRAVTQDSSTPSGSVSALRDIGVELQRDGTLEFDEATFDLVMANDSDDVVKMLSAGTNDQSKYDSQPKGLARDIISDVEESLTDSIDGLFVTRTNSAREAMRDYEDELLQLETRMSTLFDRYIAQFTVMETLVSQLNSTRNSLSETWANMGNFSSK